MNINDVVELLVDVPSERLKCGDIGVVVEIFNNLHLSYEIEFCNENGETITTVSLSETEIKKIVY
ncbi:DUF4926 domain-containing protein [Xenorhabdus bovienii]|uniref:DUF4926 domain-containing protein n=1 Tax=Xenorhabdus bovienii TaxID=40576 RepID=UPI003DA45879